MDLGTIRTALKTAIETVDDLHAEDLNDNPDVPCVIVYPDPPFDIHLTFDGNTLVRFLALILVPYVDTEDAQTQLDTYLATAGTRSVMAAIETQARTVTEFRSYGVISLADGGTRYLSAELVVEQYV